VLSPFASLGPEGLEPGSVAPDGGSLLGWSAVFLDYASLLVSKCRRCSLRSRLTFLLKKLNKLVCALPVALRGPLVGVLGGWLVVILNP
jgi:hypothetical protein